jgi:hypothetical protein
MKKLLSIFSLALLGSFATQAQETFTGTSMPTGWVSNSSSYTLACNNKLLVTMVDSCGPQQYPLAGSPAANWAGFELDLGTAINMAQGCKCLSFDIDNTGNADITFSVQAQDVNYVPGTNNTYTDQTAVSIAAGYVGTVTINYSGKFENYYGYPSPGGKIDSTQVKVLYFQPVGGPIVPSGPPWTKKFKGNFSIDNFTAAGFVSATNAAQANISSSKLYPNPVSDLARVELNLNSVSDVKVTLSDLMGKEVMTVAQGTMSSVNADINVANLNKGIYTVNYFINGAAAKSELLMVK